MLTIHFMISRSKIRAAYGVVSHNVFNLPDGALLFYAQLSGGTEFIITSKPAVEIGKAYYRQELMIFDYKMSVNHCGDFGLTVTAEGNGIYEVDVNHGGSFWSLGRLIIDRSGEISFKGQIVKVEHSMLLLSKALLLG